MLDSALPLSKLEQTDDFVTRHIGPRADEVSAMLRQIGVKSIDELIETAVPDSILDTSPLELSARPFASASAIS